MVDEVKVEETKVETKVEQVTELVTSPLEEKALEQGWVPKDQWEGDPEEWRPAKEFVERGEIFKNLHSTKRELQKTQAALSAQMRHHALVFEKAHQKALADLRLEKRQAIRNQDFEQLEAVETRIEAVQAEHVQEAAQLAQVQQTAQQEQFSPEFQEFTNKNPWYLTDPDLNTEADILGAKFLKSGGDRSQLFDHVAKEIKKRNPEKFGTVKPTARVAAPSAVSAPARKAVGAKAASINDVPDYMKDVVKNFCASTGMSEADYVKQLKEIGAF
jgi:hypothetical protein